MQTLMLNWSGEATPAHFLPSLTIPLTGACIALARRGQSGSTLELPPSLLTRFSGNEIDHEEMALWKVELITAEGAFGGIAGCVFKVSTQFKGKPLHVQFLVPHRDLPREDAAQETWN